VARDSPHDSSQGSSKPRSDGAAYVPISGYVGRGLCIAQLVRVELLATVCGGCIDVDGLDGVSELVNPRLIAKHTDSAPRRASLRR